MKSLTNPQLFSLLVAVLIAFSSCNAVQKLVDQGRYDEAFALAARKMYGKKKKKTKYVLGMETAFERLTERDMRQIKNLDASKTPQNWEETARIYEHIRDRQEVLAPLLPLYDKNGYKAEFRFVKVDQLEKEARENAAAFLYQNAGSLLSKAELGNKNAAREAYHELQRIERYFRHYKDVDVLKQKAHNLGINRIFVKMENKARVILPEGFEDEILRINIGDLNDHWDRYYVDKRTNIDFDYNITLKLTRIDVSPERVLEREYLDEKEVKDGFDYVLDENGNVLKDSLGNDIKVDRYVLLRASVLETKLSKEALVSGYIEYYDNFEKQLLRSEDFSVEAVFGNCSASYRGDQRALSGQSRANINVAPAPFPSDEILLLDAAEKLKFLAKDKIRGNRIAGI